MDVQEPLWYMSWSPVVMGGDHNVKQNKTDSGAQILYFFSFVDHRLHIYIFFPTEEGVMKVTSSWGEIRGRKKKRVWCPKMVRIHDILEIKKNPVSEQVSLCMLYVFALSACLLHL